MADKTVNSVGMQRSIWIIIAILVSTGVYFTIRYGLRPKPIPVMNPTSFERLEQIGIVTYRRLRQNIRSERVVVLGSSAEVPKSSEVWLGLIEAAAAEKERVVVFPASGQIQVPSVPNVEVVKYSEEAHRSGDLVELAHNRMKSGQLVVIIGPTEEVSHLVKSSVTQQIEKAVGHPVLSISSLKFAVSEQASSELEPQCLEPGTEKDVVRRLSCAASRVSRKYMKKKLDAEKIWAVMERHGLKEYLVFIHQP